MSFLRVIYFITYTNFIFKNLNLIEQLLPSRANQIVERIKKLNLI